MQSLHCVFYFILKKKKSGDFVYRDKASKKAYIKL